MFFGCSGVTVYRPSHAGKGEVPLYCPFTHVRVLRTNVYPFETLFSGDIQPFIYTDTTVEDVKLRFMDEAMLVEENDCFNHPEDMCLTCCDGVPLTENVLIEHIVQPKVFFPAFHVDDTTSSSNCNEGDVEFLVQPPHMNSVKGAWGSKETINHTAASSASLSSLHSPDINNGDDAVFTSSPPLHNATTLTLYLSEKISCAPCLQTSWSLTSPHNNKLTMQDLKRIHTAIITNTYRQDADGSATASSPTQAVLRHLYEVYMMSDFRVDLDAWYQHSVREGDVVTFTNIAAKRLLGEFVPHGFLDTWGYFFQKQMLKFSAMVVGGRCNTMFHGLSPLPTPCPSPLSFLYQSVYEVCYAKVFVGYDLLDTSVQQYMRDTAHAAAIREASVLSLLPNQASLPSPLIWEDVWLMVHSPYNSECDVITQQLEVPSTAPLSQLTASDLIAAGNYSTDTFMKEVLISCIRRVQELVVMEFPDVLQLMSVRPPGVMLNDTSLWLQHARSSQCTLNDILSTWFVAKKGGGGDTLSVTSRNVLLERVLNRCVPEEMAYVVVV